MNTLEIEQTVANDIRLSDIFLGVFPYDKMPKTTSPPSCFIVNTDPSNKPGEHWVAMYFDKTAEYFDSYGLEPKKLFKRYNPTLVNKHSLQDLGTAVCGEYCIYYLHQRVRGCSPEEIITKLGHHPNNDQVVERHISRLRAKTDDCGYQSCSPFSVK